MAKVEIDFESKQLAKNQRDVIRQRFERAGGKFGTSEFGGDFEVKLQRNEKKVLIESERNDFQQILDSALQTCPGKYELLPREEEAPIEIQSGEDLGDNYSELKIENGRLKKKYEAAKDAETMIREQMSGLSSQYAKERTSLEKQIADKESNLKQLEQSILDQSKANEGLKGRLGDQRKQIAQLEDKLTADEEKLQNSVDVKSLAYDLRGALIKTVEMYAKSLQLYSEKKKIQDDYAVLRHQAENAGLFLPAEVIELNEEKINAELASYRKCSAAELETARKAKSSVEKLEKLAEDDEDYKAALDLANQGYELHKKVLEQDEKLNQVSKQISDFYKRCIGGQITRDGQVEKVIPIFVAQLSDGEASSFEVYAPLFEPLKAHINDVIVSESGKAINEERNGLVMYSHTTTSPKDFIEKLEDADALKAEGFTVKVIPPRIF